MSENTTRRSLARKLVGSTRTGRVARMAGATAVASMLVVGVIAAPANAAPRNRVINASCDVPASVTFDEVNQYTIDPLGGLSLFLDLDLTVSTWEANYDGQLFFGTTIATDGDVIAPNLVAVGTTDADAQVVLSATCDVG